MQKQQQKQPSRLIRLQYQGLIGRWLKQQTCISSFSGDDQSMIKVILVQASSWFADGCLFAVSSANFPLIPVGEVGEKQRKERRHSGLECFL